MTVFFDTSVLVAAFQSVHVNHEASLQAIVLAQIHQGCCSVYTLAEFYSVTTRLPGKMRLQPEQAMLFVDELTERLTLIEPTAGEYLDSLRRAANDQVPGGRVYGFLLLACARKAKADRILTWNLKHFRSLAPDLAERIVTP